MPDESMVKQLLFAEGLVGLGGVVGRPRSTWRDRAFAALRPVLTSRLAGWSWHGVAQERTQWRALCDCALPAAWSPLPCYAQHRHTFVGQLPVTLTLTLMVGRYIIYERTSKWALSSKALCTLWLC
eukprot:356460-Chlamydomonas_euryale.AAC.8